MDHKKETSITHDSLCNLCGSSNSEVISAYDKKDFITSKVICRECGLVYTQPLPNLNLLQHFYAERHKRNFEPKLRRIYHAGVRSISRYYRIKPYLNKQSKILDAGSCFGELLFLLKECGYDSKGIEYNPHLVELAKPELGVNIEHAFLDEIELPAENYNVILSHHVLQFCINPKKVLAEYYKALMKEGILNLEVSNLKAKGIVPFNKLRFKEFYNFNCETIKLIVEKTGFKILNTVIIPHSYHINIILRKACPPYSVALNKNNYQQVKKELKMYNNIASMFSFQSYLKILNSIKKQVKAMLAARKAKTSKDLLQQLYSKVK